jgi:hypothetical protein
VFQFTARKRVLAKPAPTAKTGAAAGIVGGIWGLWSEEPLPAAVGAFVAAILSLVLWLAPEDAANRHSFHLRRRAKYDELIDDIEQRLSEENRPTDEDNKTWGDLVAHIRGSDYYRPETWPQYCPLSTTRHCGPLHHLPTARFALEAPTTATPTRASVRRLLLRLH